MKITRILLLSTLLVSVAPSQGEARPLRTLRTAEPSIELNLGALADLKPDYAEAEPMPMPAPAPKTKKTSIKKTNLKAVAGTESSPKIVQKKLPETLAAKPEKISDSKILPERKKVEEEFKQKQNNRLGNTPNLPPPTNLIPEKPPAKLAEKMPEPPPVIPNPPLKEQVALPKLPVPVPPPPPAIPAAPAIAPAKIPEPKIAAPAIPAPTVPAIPAPPPLPTPNASGQRVVQLPPLNFDDQAKPEAPAASKTASLPPVSDLFPQKAPTNNALPQIDLPTIPAKPVPPPLVISQNEAKNTEPQVGKPSTQTVAVAPPKLPPADVAASAAPALSIPLTAVENELPVSREGDVSNLATKLKASPNMIITIKSYAGGTEDQASQAKRTSLSRALSVRKYLMEKEGVSSEKISVRPMGNKNEGGVPDRIDIFLETLNSQKG